MILTDNLNCYDDFYNMRNAILDKYEVYRAEIVNTMPQDTWIFIDSQEGFT